METIKIYTEQLLSFLGITGSSVPYLVHAVLVVVAFSLAFAAGWLCRKLLVPIVMKLTRKTPSKWDEVILNERVLRSACRIVPAVVVWQLLPMVFYQFATVKELLARPRPFELDYDWWQAVYRYPDFVARPDSFSFPSGHTAAAFAAATAVFFQSRKGGLALGAFGLLMGFSRVYLEVHYCTDVLFGMLFGIVYALIAAAIVYHFYPTVYPAFEKQIKAAVHRLFPKKAGQNP